MKIFDLPIHPSADIFPMLSPEELQDMADDIKTNGLNHPIVVGEFDGETVIIDGRNRREACRIANVDPDWVQYQGDNVDAFILSENINRRHLTKGQQAMAVAMLFPEGERGGRGNKASKIEGFKLASGYISEARTVLRELPSLARLVMAGNETLSDAYTKAVDEAKERDQSEWQDREEKMRAAGYSWVSAEEAFNEGGNTRETAYKKYKLDIEEEEQRLFNQIDGSLQTLSDLCNHIRAFSNTSFELSKYKSHKIYEDRIKIRFPNGICIEGGEFMEAAADVANVLDSVK